jgi:hypothetical protein
MLREKRAGSLQHHNHRQKQPPSVCLQVADCRVLSANGTLMGLGNLYGDRLSQALGVGYAARAKGELKGREAFCTLVSFRSETSKFTLSRGIWA